MPTRITFDVKPESTEPTDPDPEEHPEAYQVRVDFRNQETGVLLDQSYSKTYSGLTKGVHNFTPVGEAQNDTEVLHYVTAPEGYEYDPAGQSAKFVTIPAAKGPEVIEFTVKEVGGEEPEPEEKEVVIQWWCVDPSHEYNYNPDNPAAHKNDHEAGSANYTVTLKEGETKTISTADVGQPGGRYYICLLYTSGQGHTISGLNVSKSDKISVGLFAVNSGTIQDVNIVAEEILGSSSVGAVAGSNEAACTLLKVHVTAEGVRGQSNVGGLVGTCLLYTSRCV